MIANFEQQVINEVENDRLSATLEFTRTGELLAIFLCARSMAEEKILREALARLGTADGCDSKRKC